MLFEKPCSREGCLSWAISGREECALHVDDPDALAEELANLLRNRQNIEGFELSGTHFQDMDLSERKLRLCRFKKTEFRRMIWRKTAFRLCLFEDCLFEDCLLVEVNARSSVYGGSRIVRGRYVNSEILTCNFNGIHAEDCLFSSCDLYDTRFSASRLEEVRFEDCNLQRTSYRYSRLKNVSFHSSNQEEAYFENSETYE